MLQKIVIEVPYLLCCPSQEEVGGMAYASRIEHTLIRHGLHMIICDPYMTIHGPYMNIYGPSVIVYGGCRYMHGTAPLVVVSCGLPPGCEAARNPPEGEEEFRAYPHTHTSPSPYGMSARRSGLNQVMISIERNYKSIEIASISLCGMSAYNDIWLYDARH